MDLLRYNTCRPESASEFIWCYNRMYFCLSIAKYYYVFLPKGKNVGSGLARLTWTTGPLFLLLLFRARAMRMGTKEALIVDAKQERERVGDRVWQRALAGLDEGRLLRGGDDRPSHRHTPVLQTLHDLWRPYFNTSPSLCEVDERVKSSISVFEMSARKNRGLWITRRLVRELAPQLWTSRPRVSPLDERKLQFWPK